MPECKRCDAVRPSADLRRSPSGGHLCIDKPRCERHRLAGLSNWELMETQIDAVANMANLVESEVNARSSIGAIRALREMQNTSADLAFELAKAASREGKTTKAIAEAFDVSASTLRGLKQTAAI